MARVCMRKEGNAREKGSGGGLEHRHVLQQERGGVCMQKGGSFPVMQSNRSEWCDGMRANLMKFMFSTRDLVHSFS